MAYILYHVNSFFLIQIYWQKIINHLPLAINIHMYTWDKAICQWTKWMRKPQTNRIHYKRTQNTRYQWFDGIYFSCLYNLSKLNSKIYYKQLLKWPIQKINQGTKWPLYTSYKKITTDNASNKIGKTCPDTYLYWDIYVFAN